MGAFWIEKLIWVAALSILVFGCLSYLTSCAPIRYIPVEKEVIVKEIVRDTIVDVKLEKEFVSVEIPAKDTVSFISTSVAESKASVVDGILHHSLKNKDSIRIEYKYITQTEYVKNDVPVEVEVEKKYIPTFFWVSLIINIIIFGWWIVKFFVIKH